MAKMAFSFEEAPWRFFTSGVVNLISQKKSVLQPG